MFCNNCHKNLEEFGALLDKMENCPLCGGHLIKEPKEVPQESFESFCDYLVESNGKDVFASEENLLPALENVEPCYVDARDRMSLLTIKQIPSRLYAAKDFPEEASYVLNQCQKMLMLNLGVSFDVSKEMILALQKVLFNKVIPVPAVFTGESFVDPRDGTSYKTVKIGEQIWMAENLRYECEGCSIYGGTDYAIWLKYGYLYSEESLEHVAPEGWRIPTQGDFRKLFAYVGKTSKKKEWHKCLLSNDDSWIDGGGTDDFGFAVLPGGYSDFYGSDKNLGNYAYFWDSSSEAFRFSIYECQNENFFKKCSIRLIKDDSKPSK